VSSAESIGEDSGAASEASVATSVAASDASPGIFESSICKNNEHPIALVSATGRRARSARVTTHQKLTVALRKPAFGVTTGASDIFVVLLVDADFSSGAGRVK